MSNKELDYCDPYDASQPFYWMKLEHLGRYMYAAYVAETKQCRRIVDAACANGYGTFDLALSASADYVLGVDSSEQLLQEALERLKEQSLSTVDFLQMDLEKDCFSQNLHESIDLIVTFETLEHLEKPERALDEFYKMLTSKGTLLLSVPNAFYEAIDKEGKSKNPHHKHLFDVPSICSLVEKAGFVVSQVLGQPLANTCWYREKTIVNLYKYNPHTVQRYYNQSPEALRYFSRLFAWPEVNQVEGSYSIILQADKQ
ncbi:class I SAM-dependent methyltransferase [Heliorestis convoluta]|uniref:Methyltransferase n=1 Tax=Heliorestis convoluta TaxID=356322 RepID=A0A5Q2MY53_9FIRM|nr:class I SAM-dependent methyltransferase [Heliorestis convoluta]QGG46259.1 Putative methyltransferase [Heliorestis convoluta]